MIRKLGAILVALTLVLTIGLTPGVALAENDNDCVRYGQGYWKQWLAQQDEDWECSMGFTAEELLGMLNTPARGNPTQILLYQFIAAALNVGVNGCEMPPTVAAAFDAALAHLMADLEGGETEASRSEILGWKDIMEFWNHNKQAVLESVVYEGTGCIFGSHAGDTLTLTFSEDIFRDGSDLKMFFKDATPHLPEVPVVTWSECGNVLTLTANGRFITPRPEIGDYVLALEGLVDLIGNPVVVPAGGVLVEGDECDKAVLESAVYEGTGCIFGSHADDTLTLTFSENIFRDGTDLKMFFKDATPYLPEVAVVTWAISDNVLTLTANGTFITPRPEVGDFVATIEGLANSCGCPVVVPDGGVEVVAMTYHYHWGPGVPYGATEEVSAVAIVHTCGMEVWWLQGSQWMYDIYAIEAQDGYLSYPAANLNEWVKTLFSDHFPDVTTVWYLRTPIDVDAVPDPVAGSILLP